jgi:hypothetical protein
MSHREEQRHTSQAGESIGQAKARLSRKYLGKFGIHGMGLQRSKSTICVYIDPRTSADRQTLLKSIRKEAAPYAVEAVEAPLATLSISSEQASNAPKMK